MSKFSNFKIKWSKSVEKLENGEVGPPPPRLAPPPHTHTQNYLLDPPLLSSMAVPMALLYRL